MELGIKFPKEALIMMKRKKRRRMIITIIILKFLLFLLLLVISNIIMVMGYYRTMRFIAYPQKSQLMNNAAKFSY